MSYRNQTGVSAIIFIYIMLKPLYLFDSGGFQICDLFLVASMIYLLTANKFRIFITDYVRSSIRVLILLVLFICITNLSWYYFYEDLRLLQSIIYYIYNALSYIFFVSIINQAGIRKVKFSIVNGCLCSLIITVSGIIINTASDRAIGFFNNPNQLGLYSVIMLTLLGLLREKVSFWKVMTILVLSAISVLASASKAAFLGVVVFGFIYVIFLSDDQSIGDKFKKIILIIIMFSFTYAFFYSDYDLFTSNAQIVYMRHRIQNMSNESDSDLSMGRGYGRIAELGINILWGLGEGAYDRFDIMPGHEIHSTFANILVSYGLIGSVLFFIFFLICIRREKRIIKNIMYLSGIILYSITHNSIRNTLVWLIFALLISQSEKENIYLNTGVNQSDE